MVATGAASVSTTNFFSAMAGHRWALKQTLKAALYLDLFRSWDESIDSR